MKKYWILVLVFVVAFSSLSFAGLIFPTTKVNHYANGRVWSVVHYDRQGRKHGHYKTYWENGKLMEKGTYKHGLIVGPVTRYSINGERLNF